MKPQFFNIFLVIPRVSLSFSAEPTAERIGDSASQLVPSIGLTALPILPMAKESSRKLSVTLMILGRGDC